MSRQPTFGPDAIRDQFRELAAQLQDPTTVYLIGGGALTLLDLKNATRDIDIIVESTDVADRLFRALTDQGYSPVDDPEAEYVDLDAAFILERGSRRFDVFNQQVAGEIHLSEPMKGRCEILFEDGPLRVEMVSVSDIFLFKSVANREDDVDDMVALAEAGIDTEVIMDEVMLQLDHLGDDHFIRSMQAKLDRLAERGYSFDIHDAVEELNGTIQNADAVYNVLYTIFDAEYRDDDLFQGVPQTRLQQNTGLDVEIQTALDWLERTDRIRVADDDSIVPTDDV